MGGETCNVMSALRYRSIALMSDLSEASLGMTFRVPSVVSNSPVINAKTVTVTITWQDSSNATHTVPLATIISQ